MGNAKRFDMTYLCHILDVDMSYMYINFVRTTIRIDEKLLISAKKAAASKRISLTKLIEEALREKLYLPDHRKQDRRVELVTVEGNGLQPGIDIDDSAALLDAMEE
mgnify:CR=1 FL=1